MRVEYSKRVLADLNRISAYYLQVADPTTAGRFEARFDAVIDRLRGEPESAPRVAERPGVRVAFLITFPYKVFYRIMSAERIKVLHVRHTSRRAWKG